MGLRTGDRAAVLALAAPAPSGARDELGELFDNVRAMRIAALTMRYVDVSGPAPEAATGLAGEAWSADVELTWRIRGFDRAVSRQEVRLGLVDDPDSPLAAAFVTAREPAGGPTPLWLLEPLHVARDAGSMVVAAPGERLGRIARMARAAVADVRAVLPRWRAGLVVEVPGSQRALDGVLGVKPGTYRSIAAVTTTVDGSLSASAPVHVFVNPEVFDPLGPNGAQIVLSHEATHVATDAAISTMPTWLLEGFADFVALNDVGLPVSVTASQILGRVRRSGPPSRLPGANEFDPSAEALGASYESAWLASRLLGDTYGEERLIRFYRRSARDGSTSAAFRNVLGTTEAAFTRAWRAYLRRLA